MRTRHSAERSYSVSGGLSVWERRRWRRDRSGFARSFWSKVPLASEPAGPSSVPISTELRLVGAAPLLGDYARCGAQCVREITGKTPNFGREMVGLRTSTVREFRKHLRHPARRARRIDARDRRVGPIRRSPSPGAGLCGRRGGRAFGSGQSASATRHHPEIPKAAPSSA